MSRGRRLKITPVLIALNILVIAVIVIFYGTRFIFYYNKFNGKKTSDGTVTLANEIIKKQSYVDLTTGLVFDEENNIYRYKGNVDDNYIEYSGILYRVIGIDNENNVKAVSDNVVTLMYSGLEKGFSKSYVNKWLNKSDVEHSGIYKNTMYGSEEYLSYTSPIDQKHYILKLLGQVYYKRKCNGYGSRCDRGRCLYFHRNLFE